MPASYHFIPADKPKLFERISTLDADCIIFDLEDAVAAEAKLDAVHHLSDWLSTQTKADGYYVRLNGHHSEWAIKEKELLSAFPWLFVVLPKLTTVAELRGAFEFYGLTDRAVIGLIEDASALLAIHELLQSGLLTGLGLGLEDFLSDSIYQAGQCADLVQSVRSRVALAAMACGLEAIDTISLDFSEEAETLQQDCLNARSAGMTAKFSIHPRQIKRINQCFAPEPDLIEKAKANQQWLETASSNTSGYFKKDNIVFSPPTIKKLKRILEWLTRK